jgi:hypothetical protein
VQDQCCCSWGAAVGGLRGGEWPEFECVDCPVHRNALQTADRRCRRHRRQLQESLNVTKQEILLRRIAAYIAGRDECWDPADLVLFEPYRRLVRLVGDEERACELLDRHLETL